VRAMPADKIKQYAVFLKISQRGKDDVYTEVKYLDDFEKARRVAFYDFMSAAAFFSDGEGPDADDDGNAGPTVEAFVARTCASNPSMSRVPYQSVTDVQMLAFNEYGEILWVRRDVKS
jgi:hypothetical protein